MMKKNYLITRNYSTQNLLKLFLNSNFKTNTIPCILLTKNNFRPFTFSTEQAIRKKLL